MSHARRVSGGEKNVSFRERALQAISVMDDWRCPIDEQTSRKKKKRKEGGKNPIISPALQKESCSKKLCRGNSDGQENEMHKVSASSKVDNVDGLVENLLFNDPDIDQLKIQNRCPRCESNQNNGVNVDTPSPIEKTAISKHSYCTAHTGLSPGVNRTSDSREVSLQNVSKGNIKTKEFQNIPCLKSSVHHGKKVESTIILEGLNVAFKAEKLVDIDPYYISSRHGIDVSDEADITSECFMNDTMRATVISWMIEVVEEFTISTKALHLSVRIMDRFLSKTYGFHTNKLQLLGVAALLIATKHEDTQTPSAIEFTNIAANSFTVNELLQMEFDVLRQINFHVASPTACTVIMQLRDLLHVPDNVLQMASFIVDVSLLDYSLLHQLPSYVACAAFVLACEHFNEKGTLQEYMEELDDGVTRASFCKDRLSELMKIIATHSDNSLFQPILRKHQAIINL